MSIAKEGLRFILPSALLACALAAVGWWLGSILLFILALAFLFFFRDPQRTPPAGENLLVSPADGKVLAIDALPSYPDFPGPVNRVTIFLSLLDVHLVRSPLAAAVTRVEYHAGKFLPAYRPEASTANESNTLVLKGSKTTLVVKQIVGVAARRIQCYVTEGQPVARGQKVGLMHFGSRVETILPPEASLRVSLSQHLKGGESVIAEVQP